MMPAEKRTKTTTSETGQIPRHLMEIYQDTAENVRESMAEEDSMSITGVFRMKKRAEGKDGVKDDDAPLAGNAAEPAQQ
jgi:hypothetical protein